MAPKMPKRRRVSLAVAARTTEQCKDDLLEQVHQKQLSDLWVKLQADRELTIRVVAFVDAGGFADAGVDTTFHRGVRLLGLMLIAIKIIPPSPKNLGNAKCDAVSVVCFFCQLMVGLTGS